MGDHPYVSLKRPSDGSSDAKRCEYIETAGRWPWKSESVKKCVTTYLPNVSALKMDDAQAGSLYIAVEARGARLLQSVSTCRIV